MSRPSAGTSVVVIVTPDDAAYLATVLRRARAESRTRWPRMQRAAAHLETALTDALTRLDVTPPAWPEPGPDTDGRQRLLTTDQTADLLAVTPETVRRWIRAGDLPAVRLGRATRIDPDDLERFLDEHRS